ncbi:MAG: TIGR04552 family protein [Pseudomonadota bacterium]|nr:TIGR04552 family protein [Pseudomonadota bacterium]
MRPDIIELDETPAPTHEPARLTALDKDAILLALTGGSVVDWTGLSFRTYEDVNGFLRLWLCDVTRDGWARERLQYVYNQAVNYLEEHVGLTFRQEVRRPRDVRDAFLRASMRDRFSRDRIQYCAVLKLMHVINHLEMQELRSQSAFREIDLIELANEKVLSAAERMRASFPLRAFYGNRKTRPSVITKLLAKRESTAATVYDKLRFRIVTETREEIVPALAWLFRNLVPFPAIIPGESVNSLLSEQEVEAASELPDLRGILRPRLGASNPDSGAVYRVVNFIVDLPVPVYEIPGVQPPTHPALLGEAVSVLVEFQVVDADSEARNEEGESRHDAYKLRQRARVYERLGRSPQARR